MTAAGCNVVQIEDPRVQKLTVKVMNVADENIDDYIGTANFPINQVCIIFLA